MKLSGGTIEWPKATSRGANRRAGEGSGKGVSPSPGNGMGVRAAGLSPRGKFFNLRRNLVQSGAFCQEIDVSPAFHLCERKH